MPHLNAENQCEADAKIHFVLYVWGEKYLRDFIDFSLPRIQEQIRIIQSNLGYNCFRYIYTDREIAEFIKTEASRTFASWEVCVSDCFEKKRSNKYSILNSLQSESFRRALSEGAVYLYPLYSDVVYYDGVILSALSKIKTGGRAVLGIVPQVAIRDRSKALSEIGPGSGRLDFKRYILQNIDPLRGPGKFAEWDNKCSPSVLFFSRNGELYIRAFHQHPVCIRIAGDPIFSFNFYGTLDEHFLPLFLNDLSEVRTYKDTSEYLACSIEYVTRGANSATSKKVFYSSRELYLFAESNTSRIQRLFFAEHPFLFVEDGLAQEELNDLDRPLFSYIDQRCARSLSDLKYTDRDAYYRRLVYYRTLKMMRVALGVGGSRQHRFVLSIIYSVRRRVAPLVPRQIKNVVSAFFSRMAIIGVVSEDISNAISYNTRRTNHLSTNPTGSGQSGNPIRSSRLFDEFIS